MGSRDDVNAVFDGEFAYDLIAEGYRRSVWGIVFLVFRANESGSRVLIDAGCGPGHNSIVSLRRAHADRAVCLDASYSMVERAVHASEGLPLYGVCGDMVSMPLRHDVAGAVILVSSLHHLTRREDRLSALRESFRVLRAGGAVLVVVWARWQVRLLPLLLRGVARYVLRRSESPWDVLRCSRGGAVCREYHLYSLGELVADVRGAGFKVVEAGTYVAPGRKSLPRKNYYVVGVKPRVNSK